MLIFTDKQKKNRSETLTGIISAKMALVLDTTLADLYRQVGIKGSFIVTMYCVFGHMDLHPEFPRELVYPEDEEPVPYSNDEQEHIKLRKIILGLKPLRRAFGLGNMDVLFFGPNVTVDGMERALKQLPINQRHIPRLVDLDGGKVFEKLQEVTKGQKLLFWRPQDWMNQHDCLVDPKLAFDINSKEYLITSGIHTPRSEVIILNEDTLKDHNSPIYSRQLPYVIKLCRAGCGFGTFIIKDEETRTTVINELSVLYNRGVKDIILSDYIDLVEDLAVHFVVGPNNRHDPIISGVTIQTLTPSGKWTGGHIDYGSQEKLHDYVRSTVQDTVSRLPDSFVGWAGIDIVVDRNGEQWVVDLNARFTGSMPICFMSNHFWRDRDLPLAQFGAFEYSGGVDNVYSRLGSDLVETGRVIVTATAIVGDEQNMADIVWGGKDHEELENTKQLIKESLGASNILDSE